VSRVRQTREEIVYEYDFVYTADTSPSAERMRALCNARAADGWRLHTVTTGGSSPKWFIFRREADSS
jgi:hypothetical protein